LAYHFIEHEDQYDEKLDNGKLSALSHNAIIRLTHKVVYKLSMNHDKVQEKVGGIMGGKVLDLPDFKVFREGKAEGLAEGLQMGEEKRQQMAEEIKEGEEKRKQMAEEIEALKRELEQIKKDKA
jgi:hypothetical protein